VSDCVTDETTETVPVCALQLRLACETRNFTTCADDSQCAWCSDWNSLDGKQYCTYSPSRNLSQPLAAGELDSDKATLCQFNHSRTHELYYTGFGPRSCPIPAEALALAELVAEQSDSFACNFQSLQCLVVTSRDACANNTACQWCSHDGVCIPHTSCYSAPLAANTPFYCQYQHMHIGAPLFTARKAFPHAFCF
jgi:hypothetical protein